jgi:hypothetical protein
MTVTLDPQLEERIQREIDRGHYRAPLEVIAHVFSLLDAQEETDRIRFQGLMREWREQRGVTSSATEIAAMPPYQKIIAMGKPAIPLILTQLAAEGDDPDYWFWALTALTDADPVRPEDRGNFRLMAQSWLEWGKKEGYVGYMAAR